MKKFIVEFGMGTDFHGQDVTKAARKAVRDAVSRSCLCGLEDVLGLTDFTRQVHIVATVAVPRPEEVDCAAVAEELPVGTVEVRPVKGGLDGGGPVHPGLRRQGQQHRGGLGRRGSIHTRIGHDDAVRKTD